MATADQILQAQRAGADAASTAQDIADRVNPQSFTDYVLGGAFVDDVVEAGRRTAHTVADGLVPDAIKGATETADNVLNVIKWVGIVALVIVGILAALWLLVAFFGLKWAAGLLGSIAPALAKNAKIVAHI